MTPARTARSVPTRHVSEPHVWGSPYSGSPGWFAGLVVATLVTLATGDSPAQSVTFPTDAGVLDVTQFGILPNDGVDDTAALQTLLDNTVLPRFGGGDQIVYFPHGVYDLSDTVQIPGAARFINLQGQSRDGVVLKLADNLTDGGGVPFAGAMFNFGGGSADRFENSIRNLTLDIGAGNASAIGLQFNASNQGVARDLKILSSDINGVGQIGLDLGYDGTIGPLLVKNVTVEGFDTGIRSQFEANSKVLEDITLRNQNVLGWQNSNTATVQVRNLVSENSVPVIDVGPAGSGDPGNGRLVLVGGTLTGTAGAASQSAIRMRNFVPQVYIRDVTTSGYGDATTRETQAFQGNTGLPDGYIDEYWYAGVSQSRRGGTFQQFENTPDTMLGLPIRETPATFDEPTANWVNPASFGGAPDDGIDDTAAIQAAIDSGAKTIYLPNGDWNIEGTLELRGSVERLIGTEASFVTDGAGRVVLGDTGAETVTIERISGRLGNFPRVSYEHDSDRTWVFKNVSQWSYEPTAESPGDLFLEDVAGGSREGQVFRNQNVWARQYNNETAANATDPELPDAKITVDGANLWVLGLKTEKEGTIVRTVGGGRTELLGVYRNGPGESDAANPAFVTADSALSVAGFSIRPNNDGYAVFAAETRDGVTLTTPDFDSANVYSGFSADDLWDIRQEVYLDNEDTVGFSTTGVWSPSMAFDGGFTGSDFLFSDDSGATAEFSPNLPVAGEYEVLLRWVNDRGGQAHSGHDQTTPATIATTSGDQTVVVNQRTGGGQWVSLGEFSLDALATLTLTVDGGGKVLADGARFRLIEAAILPGDFNSDGMVNVADYTVWRDGLGSEYTIADYQVWRANFGATPPGSLAENASLAVPEPTGLALLLSIGLAIGCRPKR
ncbi:MAG: glycosyl hydrolase family 28-related protein [Planctomycetota bacterium]